MSRQSSCKCQRCRDDSAARRCNSGVFTNCSGAKHNRGSETPTMELLNGATCTVVALDAPQMCCAHHSCTKVPLTPSVQRGVTCTKAPPQTACPCLLPPLVCHVYYVICGIDHLLIVHTVKRLKDLLYTLSPALYIPWYSTCRQK